ncbi:MAG: aminotransferase class V-fold PLP-dependent enzyme [Acidobacteriia bacterium]|nr:aminotransferase class V-fold PLP-dependent enzyme [Terriglobia bacterium]
MVNRRELLRTGGLLAAISGTSARPGSASPLRVGPEIYQSIGVKPVINCKGTFTILSGSQSLPEVKAAMDAASRHYVHMDELMDAVGKRLAEITQADWGIVTSGCAAALAHATAACIAGADPEKLQRLPDLTGMKNEVIAPRYSRNVYDHAVRMVGVRMVEVSTIEEYRRAFNDRTAMVMVLAGSGDQGPLGTEALSKIAKEKGVPLLVDAAAERLTIPNVHLGRGATMVAYSGGKCFRGPQCAGMLLGRKDLLQAAWIHSAPHHAFGRPMKVGKEEIMGMLAAVEAWVKRDHKAEWKQWEGWLDQIATRAKRVPGVTTEILQPRGLSNNSPQLRISWDGAALGVSGRELEKRLADGTPRIILGGSSGTRRAGLSKSSITIMPYMMMPGDDKLAAERIHAELASPQKIAAPASPPPAGNISGQWDVQVQYTAASSTHSFVLEQGTGGLQGSHKGQFLSGEVRGYIEGDQVQIQSSHRYEGTRIDYEFTGTLAGDQMKGSVDVGEYGKGTWTARRRV